MGLPSYAHPIIGEWNSASVSELDESNLKSATPYLVPSPSEITFPKTDSLSFLGAYKWVYSIP